MNIGQICYMALDALAYIGFDDGLAPLREEPLREAMMTDWQLLTS